MTSRRYGVATFATVALVIALVVAFASDRGHGTASSGSSPRVLRIAGYPAQLPAAMAAGQSSVAIEGTVSKVGRATWNTADRKKSKLGSHSDSLPDMIYTPFTVKVDKAYKGDVGSRLDVKAFGGTVDSDTMVFEGEDYAPRQGERVVVFVSQVFTEKNGDRLAIPLSIYTVDNGKVINRFGGDKQTMPVADLIQAAE